MDSQTLDVLKQTQQWLDQGGSPWLCTIVKTVGSSPRPVGSLLGFYNGISVGTLSGGCVEEDLLQRLTTGDIDAMLPIVVEYGVSAEENERLGLPCGGRLHVLVQQLTPVRDQWVAAAVSHLEQRQLCERRLILDTGLTELTVRDTFAPLYLDENSLQQSLGPQLHLCLVGAGQLAQVLSTLALAMDYAVTVIDPRKEALEQWRGPAVPLLHGLPDDTLLSLGPDQNTLIITLTHDPRIDDMALLEALESDAWYIGALGSPRTTAARLERLRELGLTDDSLARLHAPVGLAIGSKTPWEIAVAIMAEITQLRRTALRDASLAAS